MYYEFNILALLMFAGCVSGAVAGFSLKKIKEKVSPRCGSGVTVVVISTTVGYINGNAREIYTGTIVILPKHASDILESNLFIPSILFICAFLTVYLTCNINYAMRSTSTTPTTSSVPFPPVSQLPRTAPYVPFPPVVKVPSTLNTPSYAARRTLTFEQTRAGNNNEIDEEMEKLWFDGMGFRTSLSFKDILK